MIILNSYEAVEYIHSLERFGIKPGLERVKMLCEELGNPQDSLRFVHVAGTNGKGSTSTMISNMLMEAGYTTGLYISPYVTEFRERVQYCGEMIEHKELAYCVEQVKKAIETRLLPIGENATEFEAITAAALLYYSRKKCDYVVLEVGLGGRFDATNIIPVPDVAVLACISLDHMAVLGNTIEEIAGEKCGIIKQGGNVVSYPLQDESAMNVIRKTCSEKIAKLTVPDLDSLQILGESLLGTHASYKGIEFTLPLAGIHMVYNAVNAIEAVLSLNIGISGECISRGLSKTVMPARMELVGKEPVVILDGGHNEDCANALNNFIKKYLDERHITMVTSIMADKDHDSYLSRTACLADRYIATQANVPRALDSKSLCSEAGRYCSDCIEINNPHEAVEYAMSTAGKDDAVVVCGSFYLAGEIRNDLLSKEKLNR